MDLNFILDPVNRHCVLSALTALVLDWYRNGRPKGQGLLRGFEPWCEVIGGIVENGGFGNPLEARSVDEELDTEDKEAKALIIALWQSEQIELDPSRFGKMLSTWMPRWNFRRYMVQGEERVTLKASCSGKCRARRYILEKAG